jgi:hypothetical protein
VNEASKDNTYIEVFAMSDLYNPWIIKVIDRSFVSQESLAIADLRIYKQDVYLLDAKKGLYRFDFSRGMDIILTGIYRANQGFTKVAVYQSTLDGRELIALANSHAVYEIDWTNPSKPQEAGKYSLLHGSYVRSLWLNEDFVIVQASANVTYGAGFMINNYTWVLDRGDRTYGTAFKVVDHKHWNAFTHFNRRDNQLMIADEKGIVTYQLTVPYLSVISHNPGNQNKTFNAVVEALSKDPYGDDFVCSVRLNLTFVAPESKSLFLTPDRTSSTYHAVYPGEAEIPLMNYAIGPNITYEVDHPDPKQVPISYVLQQNRSRLSWAGKPSRIVFYRQFEHFQNFTSVVIAQDSDLSLHTAECYHSDPEWDEFKCSTVDIRKLSSPILNMSIYQEADTHLLALLLKREVILYDVYKKEVTWSRTYPDDFSGAVSDVTLSGECLFVTLKYSKTVECHSRVSRFEGFRVDAVTAAGLGIDYWSPISVTFSRLHPRLFFVSTYDAVYVLDHGTDHVIRHLSNITNSKATRKPFFKVSINQDYLVIVQPPSTIE